MRHKKLLSAGTTVLLVVDIQDAFVGHIHEMDRVVGRSGVMIEAAKLLSLPIIITEQYPKGLGRTVADLRAMLSDCPHYEKVTFSCCQTQSITDALLAADRSQVLLVGIETHVCIAQTACDLLAMNLQVHVAADAVSSQRRSDHEIALRRLEGLGVLLTTTEAAIMEMTVSSKHPAFKGISALIKGL